MYWEWTTLVSSPSSGANSLERRSVLSSLPADSSKEVVAAVVRHVVSSSLGISQPPSPSTFESEQDVEWCLQVICYGLSLPFAEHEIIKDCVSIYCEWLSCLSPVPKISVPKPVVDRPDFYARKMINQLYHLFLPRKGEVQDTINRQAILCHRVLRVLQNVIKAAEGLEQETWECVLLFLISINDAILSPPAVKDDIGDQLCERVLSVLFEVWLLACEKCFPSPPLWKSLRVSCFAWRHRPHLFDQWNRINYILTSRVLTVMYGPEYLKLGGDDDGLVPRNISDDCVVQTWYRFLHIVGNPVELTQPTIISQTQNFLQYAIASEEVVDPCQHPCLSVLPAVFHKAMIGIADVVGAFLGVPPRPIIQEPSTDSGSLASTSSPVAPMRRLAKSFSVATSSTSSAPKGQQRTSLLALTSVGRSKDTSSISSVSSGNSGAQSYNDSIGPSGRNAVSDVLASARPKVNSILHLFGPWLFEAALAYDPKLDGGARRTSRGSAVPAALPESIDMPNAITLDKYYLGRAEALGILCRIFCSKKTGEDILPAYLARFYIAVNKGLKDTRQEVLISILSNSPNLLRVDLDGVTVLVPAIVAALEAVLPTKDALRNDLRRSAIQLLLSLISLPLHFLNVPIKEIGEKSGVSGQSPTTFIQIKPRLANLLINTLQVETDSLNIQMLLGGLLLFVTDTAAFEDADKCPISVGAESPTNLLSSESASMRSFSDYSSSFDEHTLGGLETSEAAIDSAHALFVRATYLVCHRLISTWKIDLPVSLAALELLNGLSRIKVQDQDPIECRRAVKWICDFIIHQCSRPPPAHSKDLHSSIVAAFQCITTWLTAHTYLLEDKDTLHTILEVVEYGISGTKSQGKPGEAIKLKDEKDLKPVSLRVRDAAEALLAVIFEQIGKYVPQIGERNSYMVDEFVLLSQLYSHEKLSKEEIINHFRYFVIDHTILISLFEQPLGNDKESAPTITMVLRGPTGRHAWTLQLRHFPRHKGKSFSSSGNNPGRPLPINDVGIRYDIQHRYFPESADRIVCCRADKAIPPLDNLDLSGSSEMADQDALEHNRLSIILENQIRLEKSVENMIQEEADETYPNLRTEAQPPPVSEDFQTARLLLSHLGFLSTQDGSDFSLPKLLSVDSKHTDFFAELEALDSTSCQTSDTVHIFYVRAGQKTKEEILENVQSRANIHPHFVEFLLSLGWPVNIAQHVGWTGNIHTSWRRLNHQVSSVCVCDGTGHEEHCRGTANSSLRKDQSLSDLTQRGNESHGGSLFNGDNFVLYWTDVTSEIAFVVPTGQSQLRSDAAVWDIGNKCKASESETFGKTEKGTDFKRDPLTRSLNAKLIDTRIFVVWLESFEDAQNFLAGELLNATNTGIEPSPSEVSLIIFVHAMKNGLFRLKLEGEPLRMGLATPAVDGMVVSRRVLGSLIRQTALNMARRKRLESDSFQPPHVRRKLKIQEIASKFPAEMSIPEFYTQFFVDQNTSTETPESSPSTVLASVHHV